MGVLSDDEAKGIAAQLVHDIANAINVDEAASIYGLFASGDGRDALAIGLEVIPQLTAAIDRFRAGDRTLQTLNLVAAARVYNDQREQHQADGAESKRAQDDERRDAATLPAPSTEVAALLSGTSDLLETPLPHDAELLERSESVRRYSTAAATVMELTAAYQHRMIADGWTYDWRCSGVDADLALLQQKWYHSNSFFLRPAKPVQCVSIIVESRDEAISIQLQQLFDEEMPDP
jgi:hypothetical protein